MSPAQSATEGQFNQTSFSVYSFLNFPLILFPYLIFVFHFPKGTASGLGSVLSPRVVVCLAVTPDRIRKLRMWVGDHVVDDPGSGTESADSSGSGRSCPPGTGDGSRRGTLALHVGELELFGFVVV